MCPGSHRLHFDPANGDGHVSHISPTNCPLHVQSHVVSFPPDDVTSDACCVPVQCRAIVHRVHSIVAASYAYPASHSVHFAPVYPARHSHAHTVPPAVIVRPVAPGLSHTHSSHASPKRSAAQRSQSAPSNASAHTLHVGPDHLFRHLHSHAVRSADGAADSVFCALHGDPTVHSVHPRPCSTAYPLASSHTLQSAPVHPGRHVQSHPVRAAFTRTSDARSLQCTAAVHSVHAASFTRSAAHRSHVVWSYFAAHSLHVSPVQKSAHPPHTHFDRSALLVGATPRPLQWSTFVHSAHAGNVPKYPSAHLSHVAWSCDTSHWSHFAPNHPSAHSHTHCVRFVFAFTVPCPLQSVCALHARHSSFPFASVPAATVPAAHVSQSNSTASYFAGHVSQFVVAS